MLPRASKWSLFTINAGVAMARGLTYSQSVRLENRSPLANGVSPCPGPAPLDRPAFPDEFLDECRILCSQADGPARPAPEGLVGPQVLHKSPDLSNVAAGALVHWHVTSVHRGITVGHVATSPWPIKRAAGRPHLFPLATGQSSRPSLVKPSARPNCHSSRLSTSDLADQASTALGRSISPSTVWRILDTDAIKPWRYQYSIFPRDPKFSEKAGRILDLYAGSWDGKPLGHRDYIISSNEKNEHSGAHFPMSRATLPHRRRGRPMCVEHQYKRGGALQYLAAWDVRRGRVMGRCEEKTGIDLFGRLVEQVMRTEPYRSASRVFWGC